MNQVASSVRPFDDVERELAAISEQERRAWLAELIGAVYQSHPTPGDVETALVQSGLKLTYTPCVLLRAKPLREAMATIGSLPEHETKRSFRALTAVLGVADARRRAACGAECSHWWHEDLADPTVIARLLASDLA